MTTVGHDRRSTAVLALWAAVVVVAVAFDVAVAGAFTRLHAVTLALGGAPLTVLFLSPTNAHGSSLSLLRTLLWSSSAAGLVLLGGIQGWAFSAWFVAPLTAAAAMNRRMELIEAASFSFLAAGVVLALMLSGGAPAGGMGVDVGALPWISAAAVGVFAVGCLRLAKRNPVERSSQSMLDLAPIALLKVSPSGDVQRAAGAYADVFEGLPADPPPRRLEEMFAGLALKDLAGALAAVAESGDPVGYRVDVDGLTMDLRLSRLPDGDVLLAVRDASVDAAHALRLEAERDAAVRGALERTKFFASLTHELRTPLNAVLGFSDAMREKLFGPLPAKYAEYAELINESGRHMLDIVGDVVDASRMEAGGLDLDRSDFDAVDLLKTTVRLVEANAQKKSLTLVFTAPDGEILVHADRRALRQMLLNLLSNAIKFTPEKGRVEAKVRRDGPDLMVEVSDTGVGMNAEELKRLGRPFEQTASGRGAEQRGSGLGLAVVRGLAQLHGGALEAASTPGEGSTIRIRMPVLQPSASGERMDARARMDRIRRVDWSDDAT